MSNDTLLRRIQRLEDRTEIIDVVIKYATSIDAGDWDAFASVFTESVHIDFSEAGLPPADFAREAFAGFARQGLEAWDARQHISPNHVVEFDEQDSDRAVCHSYMYAQHYKQGAPAGELYLMRGSYDHHLVRTLEGWKITSLTQHISWIEGSPEAAGQ
ncbi:nuclear transport factor 2 family protein [Kineosporia babensis]|uniref:Nuclear transport factor 2 family protein n=1 Tax=Kineosporia babensis TaxID=499548 RepID=A0A9X1NL24_9ACTN|nr:nuclear transport factor 2 family protein [Kineosporia babensis]MCD5316987.1 nuclear transport factor 2 family protein [Kineosporia babensis]